MEYTVSVLSGVAGSAIFWLFSQWLAQFSATGQWIGMAGSFVVCGVLGLVFARKRVATLGTTRIASGTKGGAGVDTQIGGLNLASADKTDIASDIEAKGDVRVVVTDVVQQPKK